jgi:branched-chain amino acid aminotransferase
LEPAATVLNYGQGLFEGIKAYRTVKNRIMLFRPQKNGQRLGDGARRLLMPAVPQQLFLEACSLVVKENAEWVPPAGEGALYLRPLLFGSGADLGLKPSSECTFLIYASPTGSYFGQGSAGVRMMLTRQHERSAKKGMGHIKAIGNYAQCFAEQYNAKNNGYSDVIYLEPNGDAIDEAAGANFFCVGADGVLHTPSLGTILPGVTRESVIHLVRYGMGGLDVQMHVGKVSPSTVLTAKEAFLTGTGASITPIGHIASEEECNDMEAPGPVTQKVAQLLADIQQEKIEDPFQWLHDPFKPLVARDSFMEPAF